MRRITSSHPRLLAGWLLLIASAQSQAHAQTNARDDGPVAIRAALSHAVYTATFPEALPPLENEGEEDPRSADDHSPVPHVHEVPHS